MRVKQKRQIVVGSQPVKKITLKRKRVVEFEPQRKPNDRVPHPVTRSFSFGVIPESKLRSETIPEGRIELRQGKHLGPNKGFGIEHMWAEHKKEMEQAGYSSKDDVPAYVATIVSPGTPIYFEGGSHRSQRVAVVRSSAGMAILELKHTNDGVVWSIVTAYSGTKKNGTLVGAVR